MPYKPTSDVGLFLEDGLPLGRPSKHAFACRFEVTFTSVSLPPIMSRRGLFNATNQRLSPIASTSGRIHCELLRLLFLHAHGETTRFFEILDDEQAQPNTPRFTYRRAAFFKTKEQDRSHGSEGCGAPDPHQHRRPPTSDQETVAHFQQSLRPSTPHCLFVHSSTPHSTSQ